MKIVVTHMNVRVEYEDDKLSAETGLERSKQMLKEIANLIKEVNGKEKKDGGKEVF